MSKIYGKKKIYKKKQRKVWGIPNKIIRPLSMIMIKFPLEHNRQTGGQNENRICAH